MGRARYDGYADWYDAEFATADISREPRAAALRLLGEGPGRLLDVGCGTGTHTAAFADHGWDTVGVDVSADQLRLARERGVEVVQTDAADLPFGDAEFDAVVSLWTHTDVDDFQGLVREAARVLRPGGPFVYVGAHPCFIGPHSLFAYAEGVPELYAGYWDERRYSEGPAISPTGLRAKVGGMHLSLGRFVDAFVEAGLNLERFEEVERGEYPYMLALRWRR